MKKIVKIAVSGMCGFLVSAGVFAAGSNAAAVSTESIKTDFDAVEVLSLNKGAATNKTIQDAVFDGNQTGGMGKGGAISLTSTGKGAKAAATQAKPAAAQTKTPPPLSIAKLSSKAGVKQKGLKDLVVSADGNVYRVVKESPWWKFWDSNRAIQKAKPDSEGNMWNDKGEYVGEWQTVVRTKAVRDLQVVKGKDGQEHLYTQEGYSNKVYRDGKYLTTFTNSIFSDASLRSIKAGADDKVYAQYAKNSEDIIISVDPVTNKQQVKARVPAEIHVQTELHSREVTDNQGNTYSEPYTDTHVTRNGVDKFNVSADGRVFTQFKGNVFEEGANGSRKLLAGRNSRWSSYDNPLNDVPTGNVSDFQVDSHGNLYSVQGGRVVANNNNITGMDLGWQTLRVDDSGNVYKTENRWFDTYVTKTNLLPDAANADKIAAPEAVK